MVSVLTIATVRHSDPTAATAGLERLLSWRGVATRRLVRTLADATLGGGAGGAPGMGVLLRWPRRTASRRPSSADGGAWRRRRCAA